MFLRIKEIFMTVKWVYVIGTTAASVYSSNKASSANKRATAASLQAAELERQTAQDTLAYYKERDAQSAALQAQANAIAGKVASAQVKLMNQQRKQGAEYFDRLKTVFWPVEDGLVTDAQAYDTPERREAEAAEAIADVGMQAELARQSNNRGMMRLGVNPGSNRFQQSNNQMALSEAAMKAGQANAARDQVEDKGWARRYDVSALGRNLPNNATAAAQTATAAGNSAVQAAYAPVGAFNTQTGIMGNALTNYGNSMANSYDRVANTLNNQASMWGGAASGFGGMAGSLAGIYAANQGANNFAPVTNMDIYPR
jgi:hypothetical protein